jgi:hypothetical protein
MLVLVVSIAASDEELPSVEEVDPLFADSLVLEACVVDSSLAFVCAGSALLLFEEIVLLVSPTSIFDEEGADIEGVKAMTKTTKNVNDFFRECRQYNMLNILCLPEYFDLPSGIATNRSNCLIDCYVTVDENDMWERGKFNFYSAPTKKKLYRWGKKDRDYSDTKCDFYRDWDKVDVIYMDEYKEMKIVALKSREVVSRKEDTKTNYLKGALKVLSVDMGLSHREIAEKIKAKQKIRTSHTYVGRMIAGEKEEDEED